MEVRPCFPSNPHATVFPHRRIGLCRLVIGIISSLKVLMAILNAIKNMMGLRLVKPCSWVRRPLFGEFLNQNVPGRPDGADANVSFEATDSGGRASWAII